MMKSGIFELEKYAEAMAERYMSKYWKHWPKQELCSDDDVIHTIIQAEEVIAYQEY